MAYLTINGYEIPVLQGGQVSYQDIGSRERAFDGTLLVDRRATKRVWKYRTKPVSELVREQIIGLVRGDGDHWSFDADKYSDKGLAVSSETEGHLSPVAATAADGRAIGSYAPDLAALAQVAGYYGIYDVITAKYGSKSYYADKTATNLFNANTGNGSEAGLGTDFVIAVGSPTVTSNATYFHQGTKSVKIVTSAGSEAIETSTFSCTSGVAYTVSVFVNGTAGKRINLSLRQASGSNPPATVNHDFQTTDAWERVSITGVATATTTMKLRITGSGSSGVQTFYIDSLQAEALPWATKWVAGGSTRSATNHIWKPSFFKSNGDVTFFCWAVNRRSQTDYEYTAANRRLLRLKQTGSSYIEMGRDTSENLYLTTGDSSGASSTLNYAASWSDRSWHSYAFVIRKNVEGTEKTRSVYRDGVLVASDTSAVLPTLPDTVATSEHFKLGGDGSTQQWGGLIDEAVLLPYAADATFISALHSYGQALPAWPKLTCAGDFIPEASSTCQGTIDGVSVAPYYDSSAALWRNNGSVIEFTLEEV